MAGVAIVPVEPTEEMIDAGARGSGEDSAGVAIGAWKAMLEAAPSPWQPIETCPEDVFCLVHQGGAVRTMLREGGMWLSTASATNKFGDDVPGVIVRETGVYEPTHWMPLPQPPA